VIDDFLAREAELWMQPDDGDRSRRCALVIPSARRSEDAAVLNDTFVGDAGDTLGGDGGRRTSERRKSLGSERRYVCPRG
jgi:hypothetical protein